MDEPAGPRDLCRAKDAVREVHRLESELKQCYGLTLNECLSLCCIARVGNTPGECAEQLAISPSRISRILNALESKGLVERRFASDDKRSTLLILTELGQGRLGQMRCDGYEFSRLDSVGDRLAEEKTHEGSS